MAASYSLALSQIVVGILSLAADNDEAHSAATILMQTMMLTTMRLPLTPLVTVGMLVSPLFGQLKNTSEPQSIYNQMNHLLRATYIYGLFSCLMTVSALLCSGSILKAMGQSENVADLASSFLTTYAIATPGFIFRNCLTQFMYAKGDKLPLAYIGIPSLVAGISTAYWLLNGGLGVKQLGLPGIAWGLIVETYAAAILFALHVALNEKYKGIFLFYFPDFSMDMLKEQARLLAKTGLPYALSMIVETSLLFILGLLAGMSGVSDQAGLSYAMQIVFFLNLFLTAFGVATSTAFGRLRGENKYEAANQIAKQGLLSSTTMVLPFALLVGLYPEFFYHVLNIKDPAKQQLVNHLLPLTLAGSAVMSMRYNMNQVVRTAGDNKGSTIVSIIGMVMGLGLSALGLLNQRVGIYFIASGFLLSELLSLVLLTPRWFNRIQPAAIQYAHENKEALGKETWRDSFFSLLRCGAPKLEQPSTGAGLAAA